MRELQSSAALKDVDTRRQVALLRAFAAQMQLPLRNIDVAASAAREALLGPYAQDNGQFAVPLLPEATLTECPACGRKHVVYQTKGQIKAGRVDMAKTGKAPTVGAEVTLRFQDGDPTKAAQS